jgi:hypothetical protein
MFSGIWAKITGALALLSGVLFVWAKSERKAKQEAQKEVRIKDKLIEIDAEQEVFEQQVRKDEQKRINKRVKNSQFASRRDRASKL